MNKILALDPNNLTVTVQPGVLLNTLAEDALTRGLLYPPDPGEKFATLGGSVSTNAGGMRAVKYGVTRDYVRELTVVMPNGEIQKLGELRIFKRFNIAVFPVLFSPTKKFTSKNGINVFTNPL